MVKQFKIDLYLLCCWEGLSFNPVFIEQVIMVLVYPCAWNEALHLNTFQILVVCKRCRLIPEVREIRSQGWSGHFISAHGKLWGEGVYGVVSADLQRKWTKAFKLSVYLVYWDALCMVVVLYTPTVWLHAKKFHFIT